MEIGARYKTEGITEFTVWAPFVRELKLKLIHPVGRLISMEPIERGYWRIATEEASPDTLYFYELDASRDRPDPASHFQPEGVHGPSQIINHEAFVWTDRDWRGPDLAEMVIYELHIGTFSAEGTFAAVIPRIEALKDLGVNALEIMPVAQFPGDRNWGYDASYVFAVQNSYGGPHGLKSLINECHKAGLSVILDVVYNHFGPEGTYVQEYGPYFTNKYKTDWGDAMNFDEAQSDEVRNFFIENALYWYETYHIDALRVDAVHGIFDAGARPFLQQLAETVQEFSFRKGRKFWLIAESDLNDSRIIRPKEQGGYGFDAQWSDDFHHALHTLLTGEKRGYYSDFGRAWQLAKSVKEGFVYTGQYSLWRKRSHGNSVKDRPARQFIIFTQNHDQVGNRMFGNRSSNLVSFEGQKVAAGILLLSPYIPLLFMGEEYGEEAPFLYFISHYDTGLGAVIKREREKGFEAATGWSETPPDPNSAETFLRSKLNWDVRDNGRHAILLRFHKKLLELRRSIPALSRRDNENLETWSLEDRKLVFIRRWEESDQILLLANLGKTDASIPAPISEGEWYKVIDSAESCWKGPDSFLPELIMSGQELVLRGSSLALFRFQSDRKPPEI